MSLTSFKAQDADLIANYRVDQVLALAGDGRLRDGSRTSEEFREYLSTVSLDKLRKYSQETLLKKFQDSGFVLQDVVNELGRRLGYNVENGRYRGVSNQIGHDGLWNCSAMTLVIEVKTTDAYRINLSTIASYAVSLETKNETAKRVGLLLVVGRQDTGDLEAQIRGSKFAWDVRIISVDALIELAGLIEVAVDQETEDALRTALLPVEYTRLDHIIELLSKLAIDVDRASQVDDSLDEEDLVTEPSIQLGPTEKNSEPVNAVLRTSKSSDWLTLEVLREMILTSVETSFKSRAQKISKSRYVIDNNIHLIISLSKRYLRSDQAYWYALQSKWKELLSSENSCLCLGMQDEKYYFRIPGPVALSFTEFMNRTQKAGSAYWHVVLNKQDQAILLNLPKAAKLLDLSEFKVEI